MTLRVLDLFSGVGAFSLGLERAGMQTVAFCECDPFARAVLSKHWPEVPIHDDVRTLNADWLAEMGCWPDVICGGFPCQDISLAGRGGGIDAERSGLWSEFQRLICEVRPKYAVIENVAALLGRGLDRVLGELAAAGYDAEWRIISAADVGAPHLRERVWIVAYPASGNDRERDTGAGSRQKQEFGNGCRAGDVSDADRRGRGEQGHVGETAGDKEAGQPRDLCAVSIPGGSGLPERLGSAGERPHTAATGSDRRSPFPGLGGIADGFAEGLHGPWSDGWEDETPRIVSPGTPAAKDRRKRLIALGNALVPQIPQMIGKAIMADLEINTTERLTPWKMR